MLRFSKMHGAGNDFVMIEGITQHFEPTPEAVQALCDRHFGIGADQLLLVEKSAGEEDFVYRIFNCDGSEVEMCGNGARCFALFVRRLGLTGKTVITARTQTRNVTMRLCEDGEFAVEMGVPELLLGPKHFSPAGVSQVEQGGRSCYQVPTVEGYFTADLVAMGNPHAVILTEERPSSATLARCGRAIETSSVFPAKINVEFLKVITPSLAYVDVWERGTGITLACGSGACAAAVSGILRGILDTTVRIVLPGGELTVFWDGDPQHSVTLKGPARWVFDSEVDLKQLIADVHSARRSGDHND